MDPAVFDELEHTLAADGPEAACRRLCDRLREDKDYHALFYALLMQKRHELGVSPVPTGPAKDLPESVHAPYEDAIRHAGRLVGGLYLQDGRLPQAWWYFRMLGEPGPVKAALEAHSAGRGRRRAVAGANRLLRGRSSAKGLRLGARTLRHLQRHHHPGRSGGSPRGRKTGNTACNGWCKPCMRSCASGWRRRSNGTTANVPRRPTLPKGAVLKLIEGRDWLFEDDGYHIDTSHLSSVVQMSVDLPPCEELHLARELCAYGKRLSVRFRGRNEPPFEDMYEAYDKYLGVLTGEDVEGGVAYYREQMEKNAAEGGGSFPAEVLVNLLLRLERPKEALAVARKHLVTRGRPAFDVPRRGGVGAAGRRLPDAGRGGAGEGRRGAFLGGAVGGAARVELLRRTRCGNGDRTNALRSLSHVSFVGPSGGRAGRLPRGRGRPRRGGADVPRPVGVGVGGRPDRRRGGEAPAGGVDRPGADRAAQERQDAAGRGRRPDLEGPGRGGARGGGRGAGPDVRPGEGGRPDDPLGRRPRRPGGGGSDGQVAGGSGGGGRGAGPDGRRRGQGRAGTQRRR